MLSHYINLAATKLWLLREDMKGVTAIEYGLIAGAIAVLIIGAVQTIGTNVQASFQAVADALTPPDPTP